MIDITLLNFAEGEGVQGAPDLLREMYAQIFSGDRNWHYFWEGPHVSLRVPETLLNDVHDFLGKAEVEYQVEGKYEDNIKITAKHQAQFERLFNVYSTLSFEMDEKDFWDVLDRVCHCFLNNARTMLADEDPDFHQWVGRMGPDIWEAMCLSKTAAERSLINGWMRGQVAERDRIMSDMERVTGEEEGA